MILTVTQVIIEKNAVELIDNPGNRYYYKGKTDHKLNFTVGEKVIF